MLLSRVYWGSRWYFRKNVGARVVMDVSNDILDKGFHLYFDNYFYSPSLLLDLLARDTYCIGTVRAHRKHFPKFGKQNINKLERGSFRRLS